MTTASARADSEARPDPIDRILAAAFRVVARDTISGTRMPAIAREAKVSQGIIHYYFETKENLLLKLLDWLLDAFQNGRGITSGDAVPPSPPGDVTAGRKRQIEFLRLLVTKEQEMTRVYYDFWVQAAARPGPLQRAMKEQFDVYRRELKETMIPEKLPGRYDADVVAGMVVGLLEGFVLQLVLDEDAFDPEAYLSLADRLMAETVEG